MTPKPERVIALAIGLALSAAAGIPVAAQDPTPAADNAATTVEVGNTASDDAATTNAAATGGATAPTALPRTGVGQAADAGGAILALIGAGAAAGLAASRRLGRQA